jgi:hypothetical protein
MRSALWVAMTTSVMLGTCAGAAPTATKNGRPVGLEDVDEQEVTQKSRLKSQKPQ